MARFDPTIGIVKRLAPHTGYNALVPIMQAARKVDKDIRSLSLDDCYPVRQSVKSLPRRNKTLRFTRYLTITLEY